MRGSYSSDNFERRRIFQIGHQADFHASVRGHVAARLEPEFDAQLLDIFADGRKCHDIAVSGVGEETQTVVTFVGGGPFVGAWVGVAVLVVPLQQSPTERQLVGRCVFEVHLIRQIFGLNGETSGGESHEIALLGCARRGHVGFIRGAVPQTFQFRESRVEDEDFQFLPCGVAQRTIVYEKLDLRIVSRNPRQGGSGGHHLVDCQAGRLVASGNGLQSDVVNMPGAFRLSDGTEADVAVGAGDAGVAKRDGVGNEVVGREIGRFDGLHDFEVARVGEVFQQPDFQATIFRAVSIGLGRETQPQLVNLDIHGRHGHPATATVLVDKVKRGVARDPWGVKVGCGKSTREENVGARGKFHLFYSRPTFGKVTQIFEIVESGEVGEVIAGERVAGGGAKSGHRTVERVVADSGHIPLVGDVFRKLGELEDMQDRVECGVGIGRVIGFAGST